MTKNPILEAFRSERQSGPVHYVIWQDAKRWAEALENVYDFDLTYNASVAQIDFARKVLTRLAASYAC